MYLTEKNVTFSLRLIACVFTVLCLSLVIFAAQKTWKQTEREKNQVVAVTVLTIMFFAWPLVFDSLIGLYKVRVSMPLILGFLLTMVFQMFDIMYWLKHRSEIVKRFDDGNLQTDAQLVTTIAFAMGTLLFREPAETLQVSIKVSVPPIQLGLLLALMFIIPNPLANDRTHFGLGLRMLQKSLLNFAIGFVTVGVASDLNLRL
jgi:hypothetical protein